MPAQATSSSLVITHVQAGAASGEVLAATQEFVSVYNNTARDIEVTNWCLSNKSNTIFACLKPTVVNQALYLTAHSYMTIASDNFSLQHNNYAADIIFPTTNNTSGSITGGSDTISLKDALGNTIDIANWTTSLAGGSMLQRNKTADAMTMVDTDTIADFSKVQGVTLPVSGIYEVLTLVDECANIDGIQENLPVDFLKNADGTCYQDTCLNLDGLQITIPEEYVRRGTSDCMFDFVALQITEILPNAGGSDIGHEFIELYNPTDRIASLSNYLLSVGEKTYDFPADATINPGQYKVFYNNEIAFTLLNTRSTVALLGDDGSIINQVATYDSPKDDMAWALISGEWQYTNQPTVAAPNLASMLVVPEEIIEPAQVQQPCAANQYRHPETNRCRLLVVQTAAVTACKDGQYRSEETNRCRSIALAGGTLTPCGDNQYRSEETNRCRNLVTTASTSVPCKDNQYRSEETNRCRTIAATTIPAAAFAIEPITETGKAFTGWWALGGIGVLAVGYGAWEWRREILSATRSLGAFFSRR